MQRNRFRLQGDSADQAYHLAQRLNVDASCPQQPLDGLPGIRLLQHFEGIQDEVAAVGAVERPWFD